MELFCPTCQKSMDIRNQRVGFCNSCATYVDLITGASYNSNGQFVKNVISGYVRP